MACTRLNIECEGIDGYKFGGELVRKRVCSMIVFAEDEYTNAAGPILELRFKNFAFSTTSFSS